MPSAAETAHEARLRHTRPSARRFAWLALQLVPLAIVPHFLLPEAVRLVSLVLGGFAVHYWLPLRYKEPFYLGLSLLGALVLLPALAALSLCATAAAVYAIVSVLPHRSARAALVTTLLVGIYAASVRFAPLDSPRAGALRMAIGGAFALRVVVYLYDIRKTVGRPPLRPFVRYFFLLPNFQFPNFPLVDHDAMERRYLARDIHAIAQQGIGWIWLGVLEVAIAFGFAAPRLADTLPITSVARFAAHLALVYMLYLPIAGSFHISIGMLHLFGYDLPRTNRAYALSRSPLDFWKRANTYWREAITRIVYLPLYFRLRRRGEWPARLLALCAVFVVSCVGHLWLALWLEPGAGLDYVRDPGRSAMWGMYLVACAGESWLDWRREKKGLLDAPAHGRLRTVAGIAFTLVLAAVIWRVEKPYLRHEFTQSTTQWILHR